MAKVINLLEKLGIIADEETNKRIADAEEALDRAEYEQRIEDTIGDMVHLAEGSIYAIWQNSNICPRCYVSALVQHLQARLDREEIEHYRAGEGKPWQPH
jgi:hypothetical protein